MFILGVDLNDLVQRHNVTFFFDELNMKEVILSIHRGQNPLTVHILNEPYYLFDGIWCSIGITTIKSG